MIFFNIILILYTVISNSRSEDDWLAIERELTELREHHQRTLKDYARMEQRLENLKSELEMMRAQGKMYGSESEFSQSSGFHTTTNSNFYLEDTARSLPDLHFNLQSSTPIHTLRHKSQTGSVIDDLQNQLQSLERQNISLLEENNQLKEGNKVERKEEEMREVYEKELKTLKESKLQLAEELKLLKQSDPSILVS